MVAWGGGGMVAPGWPMGPKWEKTYFSWYTLNSVLCAYMLPIRKIQKIIIWFISSEETGNTDTLEKAKLYGWRADQLLPGVWVGEGLSTKE